MRRRLGVALVASLLVSGACGGDAPEDDAREQTDPITAIEEGLAQIDSGRIEVAIRAISPEAEPDSFEMSGAFAAATAEESLPIADLTYIDRSGIEPQESRFISDGERAWVVNEHGTKTLEDERLDALRGGGDVAGLRTLEPTTWFEGTPSAQPGEAVDGEPTTSYSGEVDVVALIEDITLMSANLGAFVSEEITDAGADRIRAAASNASLTVVAGTDDNLIRAVDFGVDIADPNGLRPILRELSANRIEFDLSLQDINEPVAPPKTPEGAEV